MKISIQQLEHTKSNYERPNQKWVCGWAKDGKPCPNGPSGPGKCSQAVQSTCNPYKDENNRFHCNRASAFGGTCKDGPLPNGECCQPTPKYLPCQPELNIRAKRNRLVALTLVLTITLLVIIFASSKGLEFATPGPLSSAHSGLLNEQGQNDCLTCHQAGDKTISGWFNLAITASSHDDNKDKLQTQCLSCHFDGDEQAKNLALFIHNRADLSGIPAINEHKKDITQVEKPAMALESSRHQKPFPLQLSDLLSPLPNTVDTSINCTNCHQEHKGKNHDLKSITDNQCQSCHQQQFSSFEHGHPEFSPITNLNKTIKFDHRKHKTEMTDKVLVCSNCHIDSTQNKRMELASFEKGCKKCHNDKIKKSPLSIVSIPYLGDVASENFDWPDMSNTELPAIMTLLLQGDESIQDVLLSIHDNQNGDVEAWSEEDAEEEEIEQISHAIKQLLRELLDNSSQGRAKLAERLKIALNMDESSAQINDLVNTLTDSNSTIYNLVESHLPSLTSEIDTIDSVSENNAHWIVDFEDEGTVVYQEGHNSMLMKQWAEFMPLITDDLKDQNTVLTYVSDDVNNNLKTCKKCHTSTSSEDEWQSEKPLLSQLSENKFNHQQHINMADTQQKCDSCHALTGNDWNDKIGNFNPITIGNCSSCHTKEKVVNNCTTCHSYHMEEP